MTTVIPTEAEWEESERTRLGLTPEQWSQYTAVEDWTNTRPVIVQWGDSQETPTQRLDRFHWEFLDACDKLVRMQAEVQDIIREAMPETTRRLVAASRHLIGENPEVVDGEYVRAQAELIAALEPIPGLADRDEKRDFLIREVTRRD